MNNISLSDQEWMYSNFHFYQAQYSKAPLWCPEKRKSTDFYKYIVGNFDGIPVVQDRCALCGMVCREYLY